MKKITLKRNSLVIGTFVWWLLFGVLSKARWNDFQMLNVVGFLFLSLIPGTLTVLSLRLKKLPFWGMLSLSVAFSLLDLMVMGLAGNFFLPKFGVAAPLNTRVLLIESGILSAGLAFIAWKRLPERELDLSGKLYDFFSSRLDVWLSFLPIVFVLQSIIGASSLNNGGTGLWTLLMLGEIAAYFLVLYLNAGKLREGTFPIAFYFIGLSLLFMTSLRGWDIAGHDIQQEFKVFEITKNAGLWNMAFYPDPYNACLSITILPTIFFNLLKVPDPYVFKFFFQFFFALGPGLAYLITRNWADKRTAFLAGLYFLAFPTYFADMPFLVRQEIALIFYGLMIYIIFERGLEIKLRKILFIVMGTGVILSHYSTTYTTLLIFTLAVMARPIFIRSTEYLYEKRGWCRNSSLQFEAKPSRSPAKITFSMVLVLFILSFLWTSIVTNTGGNLTGVIKETSSAIINGFTENNFSTDTMNLLSFKKPDLQQELRSYITNVVDPLRAKGQPGKYYSAATYSKYVFTALPDEQAPLTRLGVNLQNAGIDFVPSIATLGRLVIKFMEILIPLGIGYLLLRKFPSVSVDIEFYLLSFFALLFILANIIIPVLSTKYGILRALQQSMYVLALPMLMGTFCLSGWINEFGEKFNLNNYRINGEQALRRRYVPGNIFPIALALIFFLYSTTFLPQLIGKTSAMIYLNNTGRYYDNYLIKAEEVSATSWLDSLAKANINGLRVQVQTDKRSQLESASLESFNAYNDIFPGAIRKDAYVFLGSATVKKQRATVVNNGDQVTYDYPVRFLDENKNLIYNNGGAKIYR